MVAIKQLKHYITQYINNSTALGMWVLELHQPKAPR